MPELPEVETVRKGLENLVLNKTIKEVKVYWGKSSNLLKLRVLKLNL